MLITSIAQEKMHGLSAPGTSFRIKATGSMSAGVLIDLIPSSEATPSDSRIALEPSIIADIGTVLLMSDRRIDYDAEAQSFVISKRN